MLAILFLRVPLYRTHPEPVLCMFAVLLVAAALWRDANPDRLRGFGAVEWAMVAYVLWNVYSAVTPHKYPPGDPLFKFILIPTVIPFVLYVVGRFAVDSERAVKAVLWAILGFAAYSAAVSILQFTGPTGLVWPRYIVDAPNWPNRAVGIFNQPVPNGMVLALGLAVAILMASRRGVPRWQRAAASVTALACACGIYLTHTRVVWLCGVAVLVIGAVLAKGYRPGFVAGLTGVAIVVVLNWSRLTSSDRAAGGMASVREVDDRLNTIQTALWAAAQKPLTGWGLGRFRAVNTYHHQQWAPEIPWIRGYGIVSHENELGILAELGVVGLAAWLAVLALIAYRLWDAYRRLPDDHLCGKPLAVTAIMAMAILLCTGMTVDLRFFDFPLGAVFLLFGIAIGWADRHKNQQPGRLAGAAALDRELCR